MKLQSESKDHKLKIIIGMHKTFPKTFTNIDLQ